MPSNRHESDDTTISRRVRFGLSVLLIGHLWAVVGRPFEFATQGTFGTSPSASMFYAPMRGYSQFAYLDHGYAFFAPDPGPSHFFQAAITRSGGDRVEPKFPDLADQWPRLLYHRHFMLAEFFNDVFHPPGNPPPEIAANALATADWVRGRKRFDDVRESLVHHLQVVNPQCDIAIRRVEHRQPGLPEFFEGGVGTRDPRLLRVMFDTIDGMPPQSTETLVIPTGTLDAPAGVQAQ
jgi:hypothetical protein